MERNPHHGKKMKAGRGNQVGTKATLGSTAARRILSTRLLLRRRKTGPLPRMLRICSLIFLSLVLLAPKEAATKHSTKTTSSRQETKKKWQMCSWT
jgi:hypothetical protein